jgi:hypothetical protein
LFNSELVAFVRASIRSVWALELLLLLRRDSDRAWTVASLVQEMRASTPLVAEGLATFEAAGLIRREEGGDESFVYAPATPALAQLAEQLERAYRERPVALVRTILSSPNDKLQSFADAFRFRGGDQT